MQKSFIRDHLSGTWYHQACFWNLIVPRSSNQVVIVSVFFHPLAMLLKMTERDQLIVILKNQKAGDIDMSSGNKELIKLRKSVRQLSKRAKSLEN